MRDTHVTRAGGHAPNGAVDRLCAVVLVEGNSDRVALHTLGERLGRDVAAEGVRVVATEGITTSRAFASRCGPPGLHLPLAGLYDVAEEATLRRGLAAAGLVTALDPDGGPRRWASTGARRTWRTS